MKSATKLAALAVIVFAMSLPVRAEVIVDQSLMSYSAPKPPMLGDGVLNQVDWIALKLGALSR